MTDERKKMWSKRADFLLAKEKAQEAIKCLDSILILNWEEDQLDVDWCIERAEIQLSLSKQVLEMIKKHHK